jgi:hypothetical protein
MTVDVREAAGGTLSPAKLANRLHSHEVDDPNFWDYRDVARRSQTHGLFQYPAMMVPELQGQLLDDYQGRSTKPTVVFDPFMGSGTVMLEAYYRGMSFRGTDINPMAVLLAYVKAHPPSETRATQLISEVIDDAQRRVNVEQHDFLHRSKWFKPEISLGLSQLRGAIQEVPELDERRYLWVCLAETIRLVSNARTSTVKLHSHTADSIAARTGDAIAVFRRVGAANGGLVREHWHRLEQTDIQVVDPVLHRADIRDDADADALADVVMTSPPYGDNETTVPYGQHSYLPLQWIAHTDLVGDFDQSMLESTHRIDTMSLGGSLRLARTRSETLHGRSSSLAVFLPELTDAPALEKKVLSFFWDYSEALGRVSRSLRGGGYSFWTLGQRRVGGLEVPLVSVTAELLESHGHHVVTTITRSLPIGRKRMARRNRQGALMASETVLVTQKQSERAQTPDGISRFN